MSKRYNSNTTLDAIQSEAMAKIDAWGLHMHDDMMCMLMENAETETDG